MAFDKYQAKRNGWRISELTLLLLALIGGGMGTFLGMKAPFYHKASRMKFRMIVPLSLVLTTIIVLWVAFYFGENPFTLF
jgi:uncharacterized membrane protein YsdA (DUF1294 family)